MNTVLRTASILALALAALSTQAADLYSNLGSPETYLVGDANLVGDFSGLNNVLGYQFTATASGALGGFKAAMNNAFPTDTVQHPYTLKLFTDSGADTYGTLLGTYGGVSTGQSVL